MKSSMFPSNFSLILFFMAAAIPFLPTTSHAGGFQTAVSYTAGSFPSFVAVGDFNGDGNPDLAVENFGGTMSVFTGNGNGTFQSATNYSVASPSGVVVADFTGDGKPDIATADFFGGKVRVLINNGSGAFPTNTEFAAGTGPVFVAVGDFNGDGKPDLVVANSSTNQVNVLLNTTTGGILSFGPATPYTVGTAPFFVGVADVNGDGKLDLITANGSSNDISVLLGSGNGTFAPATNFAVGRDPISVVAGDFNGDGKIDLAVANYSDSTVSILLGNGTGTSGGFQLTNTISVGAAPSSIAAADFNDDGKLDLVTANYADADVSVLLGHGDATFQAGQYAAGTSANFVAVGDFNKDGVPDLAVANNNDSGAGNNTVSVLIGNGLFAFHTDFAGGTNPIAVVAGDFNKDGNQDVAVADNGDNGISVLLGNGAGSLGAASPYPTGAGPFDVAAGDFDNDGNPDLFVANFTGSFGTPLRGSANGTFIVRSGVFDSNTFNPVDAALADFNGDGKLDVAMVENGKNVVSVFLGKGDFTFPTNADYAVGANPISVAAGDFNGDGKPDLVVADLNGAAGANLSVLLNKGDGTGAFLPAVSYGAGTNPNEVQTGDFNGDGKLDIAVANFGGNNVSILLGNGDGTFRPARNFPAGTNPAALTVADFNGDGKLDLAVANYGSGDVSVLLGNGDGTFHPQTRYAVGSLPNSIAAADFNNDGALDLVVANKGGNVSILLNRAGATGTSSSFANPSLLSQSVTFTGIVAGNIAGSGTPTGTVTFKEGATVLGSGTLDGSGHATFATSALSLGTHVITPVYSGDLNFVTHTLPAITQIVNVGTLTALVSNPDPSGDGQGITLTATVTPAAGNNMPVGTVTFLQGASQIANCINVPLDNAGTAQCILGGLTVGAYTLKASYPGSGNFLSSLSPPLTQVVQLSTSISASLLDSNSSCCIGITALRFRQRVAIFSSLTFENGGPVPAGTVTFYMDGKPFGSPVSLDGVSHNQIVQIISQQPNQLTVGQHTIMATYSGDGNYAGSTSGPQPFTRPRRPH
ncbi:MAG TPA: FG-GAP-like repeat-containing protein [Terriglobales bacterium]|nr:FG-GAP-like repeat-containing protein [Terriglobales bacterium]